ncbi:hypothetical protein [Bacillus sp. B15-48]|uniref:hypothetical protein n=1 Tax=Bacillus sp. B15-48 TaxID=1548601 RepID=UPI00193FA431|nr:hypothetical protein [Bacillus sp. B15-48]MBM4762602.1 hypothetical protein [Bacillus sp. B15-48]
MGKLSWTALLIFTVLILSSCSVSFEDELTEARKAAEIEVNQEPEQANESNDEIEYFLPSGVEKKEETPNNILLNNGSKTYILFYNQREDHGSKVVYESTLNLHPEWDGHFTFEQDGKFGYFLVKKIDDGVNQVVTGIGGVKLTTETKSLKSDVDTMMKIVNSVTIK